MIFRGIVKKYIADRTILTKFKKGDWYVGKICVKYEGTSFTYRICTPNPRDVWWGFLFEILHFMMVFRGIGLSKPFRLIFS